MKIGWDGFGWLVRDLWQNKYVLNPNVGKNRLLPDKLIGQVSDTLDKNNIFLHWDGRDIHCQVDIPVQKGEHLLLHFKEWSGNKQLFKVLARSFDPLMLEGDRSATTFHLLIPGFKEVPMPLLFRMQKYNCELEDEAEKRSLEKKDDKHGKVIFEFVIETETFGVVIIKIMKEKHSFTGRLLVETKRSGMLLEKGLLELQKLISAMLLENDLELHLLHWEVVPAWDLLKIREDLQKISFVLDRKV